MKFLTLLVVLICGGVLQAVLPTWALFGRAPAPVLTALVIYYALTRSRTAVLWIAVLAGVVQDALGLIPLGYSSFCLCLVALLFHRYRDEVFVWAGVTHMVFGGIAALGVTLAQALLLGFGAEVAVSAGDVARKALGAAVLGIATTPLVYVAVEKLDLMLGNVELQRT